MLCPNCGAEQGSGTGSAAVRPDLVARFACGSSYFYGLPMVWSDLCQARRAAARPEENHGPPLDHLPDAHPRAEHHG